MYLAAAHCLNAHIRTSSGTTNVQSISLIRIQKDLQSDRMRFFSRGGTFGCIATHVQIKMVEAHDHAMSKRVRIL